MPKPTSVTILSLTSPIRHGANATVSVQAAPNANCSIAVYYMSGASKAAGLVPKTADGQGRVGWTWMVGTRTTPGSWPVIVTCDGVTVRTEISVR